MTKSESINSSEAHYFITCYAKTIYRKIYKEEIKMLPDKLPKPSRYAHDNDPKTEAEWEEYFECRKKNMTVIAVKKCGERFLKPC